MVRLFPLLFVLTLVACSLDRRATIESGDYIVTSDWSIANQVGARFAQTMSIDREKGHIYFKMVDGSYSFFTFVVRNQDEWPRGCPTNIHSTCMEVFEIDTEILTVGNLVFRVPILVRNCPPDPMRLVLREDGVIGGSGNGCANYDECIFFEIR